MEYSISIWDAGIPHSIQQFICIKLYVSAKDDKKRNRKYTTLESSSENCHLHLPKLFLCLCD
jgi:hypothetical protein